MHKDQAEVWRKELKVRDDEQLLVVFVWCHDEELRISRMFPEFWGCDKTFSVTKEQIHLFLFTGIYGNDTVFILFHYVMPSGEARAYHWAENSTTTNYY